MYLGNELHSNSSKVCYMPGLQRRVKTERDVELCT